jgi:2-oxo-4-hydroxy-4-carboxy-5-ureidoimidazoline decarboxylase
MKNDDTRQTPDAAQLSALSLDDFVLRLGSIYEHSPWIAERAWHLRPFANRAEIARAMEQALRSASHEDQLALIRAHPELTGRAGVRTDLTADSSREQRGAGLDQCSPEEFSRLLELNTRYRARCGFPFILAVAGRNREQIISELGRRVDNPPEQEFATALDQIVQIADFRLHHTIGDP